jgi:uncharacterized protein (DUF427 family)
VDAGAWYYPEPIQGAPAELQGLIAFYWNRMDAWFEEDEEVFGHPRDPYHRIDTRPTSRHIRVLLDGEVLAETTRAVALFESNLPTRWYLPREDVHASLTPSDKVTYCPYKGRAAYYSFGDEDDLVWYYADPLSDASAVRDMVCFFNERVDLELDGELQERPESPWSHGVKPAANLPSALTRG